MKNLILDCPIEFIEHSLEIALKCFEEKTDFKRESNSDLINIYFVGSTLCLDVYTDYQTNKDVITINYSNQSFGYFSGGYRRLLSIKALTILDKILKVAEINHEQIDWLKPIEKLEYKFNEDLFESEIAIHLYKLGFKPYVTKFIDEVTLMFGYGKLHSIGCFDYNLPKEYVQKCNLI